MARSFTMRDYKNYFLALVVFLTTLTCTPVTPDPSIGGGGTPQDTTQPVLGITNVIVTSTSIEFDISLNEKGTAYWSLVPDGTTPPTQASLENAGTALTYSSASGETLKVMVSSLVASTAYDLYATAKDSAGNVPSVYHSEHTTPASGGNPVVSLEVVLSLSTSVEFSIDLSEAGTVYWSVVANGAVAPDSATLISTGTQVAFAAAGSQNKTATLLTPATNYDLYAVAKDAENNQSAVTKLDIATSEYAPAAVIIALCNSNTHPSSDGGKNWVDIQINDPSQLTGDWKIYYGFEKYRNLSFSKNLVAGWNIQPGDIIRIHQNSWSGSSDTLKTNNNSDKWDFKPTDTYAMKGDGYGALWIETSTGAVVDFMIFTTTGNTLTFQNGSTGTGTQFTTETFVTSQIAAGRWSGSESNLSSYAAFGDDDVNLLKLKASVVDGNQAGDWEVQNQAAPGLSISNQKATPASMTDEESKSVIFSVDVTTSGGLVVSGVSANLTALGGSASQPLVQTSNTWSASVTVSTPTAGNYSLPVVITSTTAGSFNTSIPFTVTDPDAPIEPYYATASGLTGTALKAKLHDIINTGVVRFSYSNVWDQLKYTDEDPNNSNNVLLLYTGWSYPKSSNGGDANDWNREHTWAKSHGNFDTATGPGTDLHHLRPTDVTVNSARGHLDFDEGGSEYTDGSRYGQSGSHSTGNYYDGNSWEPRDAVKGDVARMMFYMAVMYENSGGYDFVDLELNDQVDNYPERFIGRLSVLKAWNLADPVDAWEIRRNNRTHERQGNRNPFIDHPEWVEEIW